jgi:hypothetical protein
MAFIGLFRAEKDHVSQVSGELCLKKGDLLFQLDEGSTDDSWNCRKITLAKDGQYEGVVPKESVLPAVAVKRARAAQDYIQPTRSGLRFWKGARINVYHDQDPNWKLVGVCGRYGFVPASYATRRPPKIYQYRSLDTHNQETRLIAVRGAADSPDGTVLGSMRVVSLKSEPRPSYETISYVWGDAKRRSSVMIDGCRLSVPQSAEQALQRLRYPDQRSRNLWIDAISINQKDVAERSDQVANMHMIYSSLKRGLIWIGDGEGLELSVFKAIRAVLNLTHDSLPRVFASSNQLPPGIDTGALAKFLINDWFSRLWGE